MFPPPKGWWGGCRSHRTNRRASQNQSRNHHWTPTPAHESTSAKQHRGLETPKHNYRFLTAFSVAVCLTRVWLSITWCSRMMSRAEALMGEPKDSSPMSDPANAWDKHHNNLTVGWEQCLLLWNIKRDAKRLSVGGILRKNILTSVDWETVHNNSRTHIDFDWQLNYLVIVQCKVKEWNKTSNEELNIILYLTEQIFFLT